MPFGSVSSNRSIRPSKPCCAARVALRDEEMLLLKLKWGHRPPDSIGSRPGALSVRPTAVRYTVPLLPMSTTATFGVIGGYGSTGEAVARELMRSTTEPILIAGRDAAKARVKASELGARVSGGPVDVRDPQSLDAFCRRCSIVVNCAGPVNELQDRVAQAAFQACIHYIDVAGMQSVREGMLPHDGEISRRGLSFVVSAGWIPGFSELLPAYALAAVGPTTARSLTLLFGDSGEWSDTACRDVAWFLHRRGLQRARHLRNGEWVAAKSRQAMPKLDAGGTVGTRRFALAYNPELIELSRTCPNCAVYSYAYLAGAKTLIAGMLAATLPLSQTRSARMLRLALRAGSLPVGGFMVVRVHGGGADHDRSFELRTTYPRGRDYWMNALIPATIARLIHERRIVKPGLRFLVDAIDASAFISELCQSGLDLAQTSA